MSQHPQQFCTNCGQPHAPGTAFCLSCGVPVSAPSAPVPDRFSSGVIPPALPSYTQTTDQDPDDMLLAALIIRSRLRRKERRAFRPTRRNYRQPGYRLRGCGCFLLLLVIMLGLFAGFAFTTGIWHTVFAYIDIGLVFLFVLFLLIIMLATRQGREVLRDGLFDGLMDFLSGGGNG